MALLAAVLVGALGFSASEPIGRKFEAWRQANAEQERQLEAQRALLADRLPPEWAQWGYRNPPLSFDSMFMKRREE